MATRNSVVLRTILPHAVRIRKGKQRQGTTVTEALGAVAINTAEALELIEGNLRNLRDAIPGDTVTVPPTEEEEEERAPYPWCPRKVQPITGDSLVDPTEWTFELSEEHERLRDGSSYAKLVLDGFLPVNLFSGYLPINLASEMTPAPEIAALGTFATPGGTIEGESSYYVAVVAVDAGGLLTEPSNIARTTISAVGSSYKITITVRTWPVEAVAYRIYIGNNLYRLTQFGVETLGTPATIDITSYPVWDFGIPDQIINTLVFRVKRVEHSGVWALQVTSVSTDTLSFPGAAMTTDEWAGRHVTLLAKADGTGLLPIANFLVTGNTADDLEVTPDPDGIVDAGDVVVMRSKTTAAVGVDYIEDFQWVNALSPPGTGLDVDAEIGHVLRIIAGTGRGDVYWIVSNTSTRIYVQGGWIVGREPDDTSVYIIERPEWLGEQESELIANNDPDAEAEFNCQVTNWEQQTVLVQVLARDAGGTESPDFVSPIREIFLFGGTGPAIGVKDRVINATGELELFDGSDPAQGTVYTSFPIEPGETVEIFEVQFTVYDPPTGDDIILDLERSDDNGATWGASIFTTPPHIVDGTRETLVTSLLTDPVVGDVDTWLRLSCTQVGSSYAGANLRCIILYRVIGI